MTLVVFARAPERGKVKTRLAAALGEDAALALYRAFLDDVCALAAEAAGRRVLAVAGDPTSLEALSRKHGLELVQQEGHDLGDRMDRSIRRELAHGPVCIIGSDSPSLPAAFIRDAFVRLRDREIVIGPSTDGGYWLVGATRPIPEIFASIEWSTDRVLVETLRRLANTSWGLLPFWYDVDDAQSLALLRAHLPLLAPSVAPATRAALANLPDL